MPLKMFAAVVEQFGKPLELLEWDVPSPGAGQILVKTEACGVCHTGLHAAHGDWPVKPKPPFIPGPEAIGLVTAVGSGVTMVTRLTLVLSGLLLFVPALSAQQSSTPPAQTTPTYAAIPVEAATQPNPVKSTPESIGRAKKWWTLDCAMCHGKDGDGKGETAKDMKLTLADFTDSATLKDRTDGEIFYIIKNGHKDMPPEGQRIKPEVNWDLVNYVRSLAKKKPDSEQKPQ